MCLCVCTFRKTKIPEKQETNEKRKRKEKKGPKFRIPRPAGEIERADTARATRISHQQQQQQHGSTAAINNRRPRQTCVRQNGNDGKVFEPIQSLKKRNDDVMRGIFLFFSVQFSSVCFEMPFKLLVAGGGGGGTGIP
jgi:hypothetical protein